MWICTEELHVEEKGQTSKQIHNTNNVRCALCYFFYLPFPPKIQIIIIGNVQSAYEIQREKNTLTNIPSNFIQKNFPFLERLGDPTVRGKTNRLVISSDSLQVNHFNVLGEFWLVWKIHNLDTL